MNTEPTICANCRYYQEHGDIWYEQFCKHPLLRKKPKMNYVTGKTEPENLPFAREINTEGNCPAYKPKFFTRKKRATHTP